MKPTPEERILDACLEEMLGAAEPPDLSARILKSWQASTAPPPPPPLPPEAPPAALVRPARSGRRPSRSHRVWWTAALVATAGVTLGVLLLQWNPGRRVAEPDGSQPQPAPAPAPELPPAPTPEPDAALADDRPSRPETKLAPFDEAPFATDVPRTPEPAPHIATSKSRRPDEEVVRGVNSLLAESWREAHVTAAPATEEQWCRRVYLQLLGRIPTVQELRDYVARREPDKRASLVQRLQTNEPYADEYAGHWAAYWTNVLIGRRGGTDSSDPASRAGLEDFLRAAIREDQPYDATARELIAATGGGQPGAEDYNGAANFLLASLTDDKAVLATDRTFRVFHGVQVRCIQCHAHPMNDHWSQQQYWELNSFFRQARVERSGGAARLVNRDFAGEGAGDLQQAEIYFEMLNGLTVAAYPAFPGAAPLSASGRVSDFDRRAALATLITRDRQLSLAVVNRLWSHFHGFGFTRPIDDMGPHNAPSHPELLNHLADQFEAGGYRLRSLTRWIALSDSFSRSSQMSQTAAADSPESGGRPLFSRYYTRQLQPEAVYDSLLMVAQADAPRDTVVQARRDWLGQFAQPMGTDDGEEMSTFRGDVRQSIIIMNGPLMRRATSSQNPGSLLHRVVNSRLEVEDKIDHLFEAALARKPTRRERSAVKQLQSRLPGDEAQLLESIWWALLNSNEFILDH